MRSGLPAEVTHGRLHFMPNDEALGDCMVDPTKGTAAFSAGLHGWAFTLTFSRG